MKIYNSMEELVGNTPVLRLSNIEKKNMLDAVLLAKLECFNPAGSAKDRAALFMINDAEEKGLITSGATIIEPTSGNTGIAIAAVAAKRGYRAVIVMPDSMSVERRMLLKAYGAEVVLTDGKLGMAGAIEKAEQIQSQTKNSIIAGQFSNPANPRAHFETTGPEIWRDTDGKLDIFIAGVGTGGTLSGIGKYLKQKNKNIKIIGIEPKSSPLISAGKSGPHGLTGIGANFIPDNFDKSVCDEIMCIEDEEAYCGARDMAAKEGILVGITSGAAISAAIKTAQKPENKGKTIMALLPDTGERYLSTPMFSKD